MPKMKPLKISFFVIACCIAILSSGSAAIASDKQEYYASIRANEANVRTGPSARYPIQWVYLRRHWPIKVLATFEQWKKIRDRDGQEGWVHEVLISNNRYVIINGNDIIKGYRLPIPTAAPTVMFEKDVVASLLQCKGEWCKVSTSGHEAWLEKKHLWGVEKDEEFN